MDIYFIAYKNGIGRHDGVVADITDYKNLLTDWFVNHTDMPTPLAKPHRIYWQELCALYKYASSIVIRDDEMQKFCNSVRGAITFIYDSFGTLYDKNNTEFYIEVK